MPLFGLAENAIQHITVFHLEDVGRKMEINEAIKNHQFIHTPDLTTLNFGFSTSNHWIKIIVTNHLPSGDYKLQFATAVLDTIEVYQAQSTGYKKTLIGEGFPNSERYFNYLFSKQEKALILYVKLRSNGQPIALPMTLDKVGESQETAMTEMLSVGVIYGIIFLILVLNSVLFLNTREKIYCYSIFFNAFSMLVLLYFDGIIKLFVFPNSLYWNNETIAIAFCGSFIFSNLYISEFLNIREKGLLFKKAFSFLNMLFLIILIISFWHPVGFNLYLQSNLLLTSVEALLFFLCILSVRKTEQNYFVIQLVGVVCLIIFGTIAQLFFSGLLPLNFITNHVVHFVILPQLFIQTIALGKRLAILVQEQSAMQLALIKTSEHYSHSLINTIEDERKRLSKEFHDSIGQNILVLRNSMLKMLKGNADSNQQTKFNELLEITAETLEEIRQISQNLRPTTLDTIGLTASISSMIYKLNEVEETSFTFNCSVSIDQLIDKDHEINIYRIVQELTSNILKHAKATEVTVTFQIEQTSLILVVQDNGIGFNTANSNRGNGLSSIKERVNILKGQLLYRTGIDQGTTTTITIPRQL